MQCFADEGTVDTQPEVARAERKTNEDINESGISPSEAFARFAGKTVDYKAAVSTSLTTQSVVESPQDRYRLLKASLVQLRSELHSLPKDAELSQVLLKEIVKLEATLEETVKDAKLASYFSEPLMQPTQVSKTTTQLLTQLKTEAKAPPPPSPGGKAAPPPPGASTEVTYDLYLQADQKASNTDLSTIEKRVLQLEQTVGISEHGVFPDLQSGIIHLRRQLSVFENPRELEGVVRKVNNVLAELQTLEEQKVQIAGSKSQEGAINKLYKVIPDWDAASCQLPGIVARLQSLKALCEQGAAARNTLNELQKEQTQMDALLKANQDAYTKLLSDLRSSMTAMEAAVATLDKTFADATKIKK